MPFARRVGQGGLRGGGPVEVSRLHDPQEQPGTARALRGTELAAEGNRGAAVVVGEDLLGQPGEAFVAAGTAAESTAVPRSGAAW